MSEGPTKRWFKYPPHVIAHPKRHEFAHCTRRFIFNHSGRRSYKTETFKRKLVLRCMKAEGRFLAGAPTHKQAKRIFWEDLKKLTPSCRMSGRPSESDLVIRYDTGAELMVAGLDAPDRIEGNPLHGSLLDEYGNMVERVWPEVIAPMLADTGGFGWFSGVPEGRNHYYDLIEKVKRDIDVAVFHWPSWDMMDAAEIERQRGLVDELTFNQEFGGEFVHFAGRAYYAFDQATHCAALRETYSKEAPVIFCYDFNVDPGVAAVCQERMLPNGKEGTAVIGEVYVPRNSNTEVVTRKLVDDWGDHEGDVYLYGDFTGGARGSAKVQGSDWDIIKRILRGKFNDRIHDRVKVNPPVRDRVNAMNARLKAVNGDVRMMVDPVHAPHVVKDLEGVTILEGSAGELDKKSAPQLTHISDGLGYYIAAEYGFRKHSMIASAGGRFA